MMRMDFVPMLRETLPYLEELLADAEVRYERHEWYADGSIYEKIEALTSLIAEIREFTDRMVDVEIHCIKENTE